MDPEETLRAALRALERGDKAATREFLGYYGDWRSRGGFEPVDGDARAQAIAKRLRQRKRRKQYGPVGPRVKLVRVPLNQGGYEYGKYGQYYGRGEPLYRYEAMDWDEGSAYDEAMGEPIEGEFRARSRKEAKARVRARVPGARMRGLAGTRRRKSKCKFGKITRGPRKGQCRLRKKRR